MFVSLNLLSDLGLEVMDEGCLFIGRIVNFMRRMHAFLIFGLVFKISTRLFPRIPNVLRVWEKYFVSRTEKKIQNGLLLVRN